MFVLRPGLVIVAVALGLLAAGCGGESERARRAEAQQAARIEQTVQVALADLASANGPAFCSLATAAGRADLVRALPGYSCVQLVDSVGRHLSAPHREGLLHVQVKHVTVHGSTATVSDIDLSTSEGSLQGFLDDGGRPTRLALQPDGTWKLTG